MKRILIKSIILSVVLNIALAGNIWADGFGNNSMQKATENFGSNNVNKASASTGTNLGGNPNDPSSGLVPISATEGELPSPIGADLGILSSLGLAYGCYLFLRKRKQED